MGMKMSTDVRLSAYCMNCLVKRQLSSLEGKASEEIKSAYMKEVFRIIGNSGPEDTAPVVLARISQIHQNYFHEPYSFDEIKKEYNWMMLKEEAKIRQRIQLADDSLRRAVQYARVGNYIDFGAMDSVENEKLYELLSKAEEEPLDASAYLSFQKDVSRAEKIVYLTDNCGEIVLDKLLIEQLLLIRPSAHITVIVRGEPVINDATVSDAEMAGLAGLAQILGNGTGIAGTSLRNVPAHVREIIENADMIISKGQGNFETMNGCGLNVYYLFLCKCPWFTTRFGLELYKGVFLNDLDLHPAQLSTP